MAKTTNVVQQQTSRYQGKTKKEWKRTHKSSTPGSSKGDNCKATSLEKALIKYPRAYRTMPALFNKVYEKKERYNKKS